MCNLGVYYLTLCKVRDYQNEYSLLDTKLKFAKKAFTNSQIQEPLLVLSWVGLAICKELIQVKNRKSIGYNHNNDNSNSNGSNRNLLETSMFMDELGFDMNIDKEMIDIYRHVCCIDYHIEGAIGLAHYVYINKLKQKYLQETNSCSSNNNFRLLL